MKRRQTLEAVHTHTHTHTHTRILLKDKKEKGSIVIYVIVSFIFLIIVLISMLAASKNSLITALKAQETIKNIYENDVAKADEIYSKEIAKQSEPSEPVITEQTWTQQDRTWVEDNNGMRLEVGSPVTGYSVTANGTTYGNGKWYILGARDGKLLITTNENIETVTLSGQNGYVNGIAILNKEAAKYTNYNFTSETARTIDVDDINRVTGYSQAEGSSVTYSKNSSDGYIYYNGTKGSYANFIYWTRTGWKKLDSGENSTAIKDTYYYYYPQTLSNTSSSETSINGSSGAYNLLFANTFNGESSWYWLGSEFEYNRTGGYVSFGLRDVNYGIVNCCSIYASYDYVLNPSFGLRPVVTLDNSVKVTSTGGLTQSRSDGGTYTEQQQNWEQDKTIVKDRTYNYIFEVGGAISGYTANSKSDWYVLGAKNGKLLLTTNNNATTVAISGQAGYTGGISTLNTTAANYTNSNYAEGNARTIGIEDVNRVTGYDPNIAQYNSGNDVAQWKNQVTYTKNSSDGYIYYRGTKYPTSNTKSSNNSFTYWTGIEWKNLGSGESITITHNQYGYYPQTLSMDDSKKTQTSINGSSNAYSLLFANTSSGSYYWLDECNLFTTTGCVGMGIRFIQEGYVSSASLYWSQGTSVDRNFGLRPVVTLKSSVKVSGHGVLSL